MSLGLTRCVIRVIFIYMMTTTTTENKTMTNEAMAQSVLDNNPQLVAHLKSEIARMRNNPIIMKFCRDNALEEVAAGIREKAGTSATVATVEMLEKGHKKVADRVEEYTTAGLVGCLLAQ